MKCEYGEWSQLQLYFGISQESEQGVLKSVDALVGIYYFLVYRRRKGIAYDFEKRGNRALLTSGVSPVTKGDG